MNGRSLHINVKQNISPENMVRIPPKKNRTSSVSAMDFKDKKASRKFQEETIKRLLAQGKSNQTISDILREELGDNIGYGKTAVGEIVREIKASKEPLEFEPNSGDPYGVTDLVEKAISPFVDELKSYSKVYIDRLNLIKKNVFEEPIDQRLSETECNYARLLKNNFGDDVDLYPQLAIIHEYAKREEEYRDTDDLDLLMALEPWNDNGDLLWDATKKDKTLIPLAR